MGRLNVSDVELRYPSQGDKIPYFSLKNDKETRQIRFLYNTINDIYFDVAHDVNINGKTQTIACLNSDGTNPAACPLCAHNHSQSIKLFIPVLDLTDNKVKIWTRGKKFVSQLQALAARNNPISGAIVEVMRVGAPRDPSTQYVVQPIAVNDGMTVEALNVQLPDVNSLMRTMDYNQMNNFALTIDGNVGSAMPANNSFANPTMPNLQYTPSVPNNYSYATYNNAPTAPAAPMASIPNSVPNNNMYIGSEPVRRPSATPPQAAPANVAPMGAPTTPMQGVPTSVPQSNGVSAYNQTVSPAATPTSTPTNFAPIVDDDLPF